MERMREFEVIRGHRGVVIIFCGAVLLAGPAFAQAIAFTPIVATTTVAAPIFASADDSLTHLVMARQGSRLTVLDRSSGWYHVTFKSSGPGRSDGYVQIKNVSLAPVDHRRLKQVNVSVSDDSFETQRTYHTLRADIRRRFAQSSRPTPPIGDARYRRGTGTIDEPRSELKPDATADGCLSGDVRAFRY
jgi:hypothetical protein